MKKVMYRFYWLLFDFEKEEKWINKMSAQGWHLEKLSFPGRYTFIEGDPGKYIYKHEFIEDMAQHERNDYLEFLEDSGITIVKEFGNRLFMRKPSSEGPFKLFTDTRSEIVYYKKFLSSFIFPFFLLVILGIMNINIFFDGGIILKGFLNLTMGCLAIISTILCLVPMIKTAWRIIKLKKQEQFFE